jgi:hypothetical protein
MRLLLLMLVTTVFSVQAKANDNQIKLQALLKQREQIEHTITKHQSLLAQSEEALLALANEKQELEKELVKNDEINAHANFYLKQILQNINQLIESNRRSSRGLFVKAKFKRYYKCLQMAFSNRQYKASYCEYTVPAQPLSKQLLGDISFYERFLYYRSDYREERKKHINSRLYTIKRETKRNTNIVAYYLEDLKNQNRKLSQLNKKIDRLEFLIANAHLFKCQSETKKYDLEAEFITEGSHLRGPFHQRKQDHQSSMGTCYANTAKNLIISATKAKSIPSFLDLALLYKGQVGEAVSLDLGHECSAIEQASIKGYCDQKYSPIESGNEEYMEDGLFLGLNIKDQIQLYSYLSKYLRFKETAEEVESSLVESFLKQAYRIQDLILADDQLEIPFPSIKVEIFPRWKAKEIWHWEVRESGISLSEFFQDYEASVANFKDQYFRIILNQLDKSLVEDAYLDAFQSFLLKYDLKKYFVRDSRFFQNFIASYDFHSKYFIEGVDRSVHFFNLILETEMSREELISRFSEDSLTQSKEVIAFLKGFRNLIHYLDDNNLDTNKLFDESNQLIDGNELIQLAVAPSCSKPSFRTSLPTPLSCQRVSMVDHQNNERISIEEFREIIISNLENGLALGNMFKSGSGYHINTIAGYRYNAEKGKCELKIRESQYGGSHWSSEKEIFDRAIYLTKVEATMK